MVHAAHHRPFWIPDLKKWVDAGDLQPGMRLQASSRTWVQVSAVQAWTQNATVHNLTVESTHTYHVTAGNATVLVHNTNCPPSQQLSDRASQIHAQAGSDIAKEKSTVAVVRAGTPLGNVDVVAGTGNGLNRRQKGMLRRGEILADNVKGTHAEQNALLFK
ncbi:polymorphic toxin-type HINT domain-containing protein [Streptomyces sp. NPDC093707]|uniref:polymorphic toxin-type HINT domain-containing protein n=1 Tax=Streptomyces sp. NPDC093707 TaxID=3154984 RepID=UPI00344E5687